MQSSGAPVTILRLSDDLTVDRMREMRAEVLAALQAPGHLVLDMREVSLDSTGLGAVLSLQRQLELQERRLAVVSNDPGFISLLDRAGALAALTLFSDVDQAYAYLQAQETLAA